MANLRYFLLYVAIIFLQFANATFGEESTNFMLLDTALNLLNTMDSLISRCQKTFEMNVGEQFFFKNVRIHSSALDHEQKLREIIGNIRKYVALAPQLIPQWKEARQQLLGWEGARNGGGNENPAKATLQSANALIGEWKSMRFKGQYRDEMEEELDSFSRRENDNNVDGEKMKSVLELAFNIYKITYDVFRKAENAEIMKITLPSGYINIGANLDKRLGQINGLIRELAKDTAKNFKEINLTDLRKKKSSKALEEIKQSQTGQRLSNEYKNLLLWKKMLEACHKMWEKIKRLHRTLDEKELNYFQMTSETAAGRITAEIVKVKRFIINEINGNSFFNWQEELDDIAEGKKWESSADIFKVKYEDDEDMHYFIKHAKEMTSSDLGKLYWIYDQMRMDFALDWLLETYNESTGEEDKYYELPMSTEERIVDLLKIAANYNLQNRRSHSQDPQRKMNLTRSNSESMLHIMQKDPSITRKRSRRRSNARRSLGRRSEAKEDEKKMVENDNAKQNSTNKIMKSEEKQNVQEEEKEKKESKTDDMQPSKTTIIQRVRIINARQSHRRRSKSAGRKRSSERQTRKLDPRSIRKEINNQNASFTETRESAAVVSDPQPSSQKIDSTSSRETRHQEEERGRRYSGQRRRSGRQREVDDDDSDANAAARRGRRRSGSDERRESGRRRSSVDRRRRHDEGGERGARRNSNVRKSSDRNDRPRERDSQRKQESSTRRRSHRKYENVIDRREERRRKSNGSSNDDVGERKLGKGRDDNHDERRKRKSGGKYEREKKRKSDARRRADGNERKSSGDGRYQRDEDRDRRERKSAARGSRHDGKRKSGGRRHEERREATSRGGRRNEDRRERKSSGVRHHRDGRMRESGGRHQRH